MFQSIWPSLGHPQNILKHMEYSKLSDQFWNITLYSTQHHGVSTSVVLLNILQDIVLDKYKVSKQSNP